MADTKGKGYQAVVLSHTKLGYGFCTNLGLLLNTGNVIQMRPRAAQNNTLSYDAFGYTEEQMLECWLPGRVVTIPFYERTYFNKFCCRITHPEDCRVPWATITDRMLSRADLRTFVEPMTHQSIDELFPQIMLGAQRHNSAYVPHTTVCEHSVGYVSVQSIERVGDAKVIITDNSGNTWASKLKGVQMQEANHDGVAFNVGSTIQRPDMLVRFALSAPFGDHVHGCWVMVSDILW